MADGEPVWLKRLASPWGVWGGVAALLVVHLTLATAASWNKSATFDETAYIGNGFSFWVTGDYRMSPDAILPQRWMTLPLYLAGYNAPPTDDDVWFAGDVWSYGMNLLYRSGNDGVTMLRTVRFMVALLSAALALVTFLWARKLCGTAGAFVALTLYVFNPSTLAHGSCATSDIAAALAFTCSLWGLWTILHRATPLTVSLSCLAVACAFTTKLSAVLLIPIGVLMAVIQLSSRRPLEWRFFGREGAVASRWKRLGVVAGMVVAHVAVAWFIVWLLFGFRFDAMPFRVEGRDLSYHGIWHEVLATARKPLPGRTAERNALATRVIDVVYVNRLLPEGYLLAFVSSMTTTAVRSAFLDGRYGIYGFPSFFPLSFLYKTPPAVFLAILLAIAAHTARRLFQLRQGRSPWTLLRQGLYVTTPLWLFLSIYWTASITRGINIGLRHLLPTFPATFILAGLAGIWLFDLFRRRDDELGEAEPKRLGEPSPVGDAVSVVDYKAERAAVATSSDDILSPSETESAAFLTGLSPTVRTGMKYLVASCLLWNAMETLIVFPNFLAYFNVTAGGSANGYRHLVDSSLDWGQELPNLKAWVDRHAAELPPRIYVSYFGTTPPSAYGLEATWLPAYLPADKLEMRPFPTELGLMAGVYCISATSLQCVYNGPYCGPWRDDFENDYRNLSALMMVYMQTQNDPETRAAKLAAFGLPNWETAIRLYEFSRFGRLCSFLRQREPDDSINYAILIYRLSNDDLKRALLNPPTEHYPAPASPLDNVPY